MNNKKLVAIITLLCFALTFMPFAALANDAEPVQTVDNAAEKADIAALAEGEYARPISPKPCGVDGDNVTWKLIDGVLTISGNGEMASWNRGKAPWYSSRGSIQSVVIDDGVTNIGNYAFYDCSNLTEVAIPNGVTSIGYSAFEGCSSLASVTIPDSVTSIDRYAFAYCSSLTNITIPNSVASIGGSAFTYCSSLTNITIPSSVASIGDFAFYECSFLKNITIQEGVTSIDRSAFARCSSLTNITIPNSVTSIGNSIFDGCTALEKVTLSNRIDTLDSCTFYGCKSLTEIVLPDNVTKIYSAVFGGCTGLKIVEISNTIKIISGYAFEDCPLEHIKFRGTRAEWKDFGKSSGVSAYLSPDVKVTCICKNNAHKWQELITATCTTAGTKTTTCSECDYRMEEEVAALGHNYADTPNSTTPATCTTEGAETYICTREQCGEQDVRPIAKLEHDYRETITEQATCTTAGTKRTTCSECDYHKEEPIAALGHDYKGKITTPATSTTEGVKNYTCTRCNDQYTEKIPATGTGSSSGSGGSGGFTGSYNHPVGVDDADNATVSLDKSNAIAGETVTITVTPEAGKVVNTVTVTDKDKHALNVTKVGDNQYQFVMPNGAVKIAVTTKAAVYGDRIVLQIDNRNVLVNNYTITNDVAPVIVDNRTMVPIRIVTETLGGTADWNEESRTVTLHIDGKTLRMTIDQTIEGFDVPPVILNERTYVPVRYVAEKLGAKVDWIAETQQIIVTK